MKRFIMPLIGVLAAFGAAISIARTYPRRQTTDPPAPPPVSDYSSTVAAVGLVETSTENISIGTPLSGVVAKVFVTAGQMVRADDPLFEIDMRHLRADLKVNHQALAVARARVEVAEAHVDDLQRQLEFAERIEDKRAISAEEVSHRRSAVDAVETEIDRSTVRAPIDAEVLQVKLRAGEFATAAPTATPMILLGRSKPLHVRVDVDEHEAWRVGRDATAMGHLRGNAGMKTPLRFVRFEPFVVPKKSLTGDSTERVDTRVLQVIYRVERDDLPLFVGQQLDVFIEAGPEQAGQD